MNPSRQPTSFGYGWLAGLAILRVILPFFLQHPSYQPHRDEYLYLDYAHHMDWGYLEVPPLLSVFSWLTIQLGGGHFWVKFWPALFSGICFLLCGWLVKRLGGGLWALWMLFLAFVFGAYLRTFFLFQPGFLEVTCWTAITVFLILFQQTGQRRWLYAMGIACGLGMLAKYTTAFFLTGLLVALLLTPQRSLFTNRHFWLAALTGFLIWLPNLYWQYDHHFPVVHHMRELRDTQLVHLNPFDFLIGQLMMNFVFAFLWIAGLLALFFVKCFRPYRWYGIAVLLTLALLMAGSAKEYYALGLYPVLMAFGAVQLERFTSNRIRLWRVALLAVPLLLGIFILPLGLPAWPPAKLADYYEKTGMRKALGFRWEDMQNHPLPQDFADMIGWREIAEKTADLYHQLPDSIQRETIIYGRGYYTAGAVNFFGGRLGLPRAISDNGSYLLWIPREVNFRHMLMIAHREPKPDDDVFRHFERRQVLDSLRLPYFREDGIRFFWFENGSDSMRLAVQSALEGMHQQFGRR